MLRVAAAQAMEKLWPIIPEGVSYDCREKKVKLNVKKNFTILKAKLSTM